MDDAEWLRRVRRSFTVLGTALEHLSHSTAIARPASDDLRTVLRRSRSTLHALAAGRRPTADDRAAATAMVDLTEAASALRKSWSLDGGASLEVAMQALNEVTGASTRAEAGTPPAAPEDSPDGPPRTHGSFDSDLTGAALDRLGATFDELQTARSDVSLTWRALHDVERRTLRNLDALRWLGPTARDEARRRIEFARGEGTAFAATLLLLGEGDSSTAWADRIVPATLRAAVRALWLTPAPLPLALVEPRPSPVRRELRVQTIRAAGTSRLGAATVVALLRDSDVHAAAAAIEVVAEESVADALPALETLMVNADPTLRHAALVAATIAGSGRALAAVRAEVARLPVPTLVELLGTVGDERDVDLLVPLALRNGHGRKEAIESLGYLGATAAIAPLLSLLGDEGPRLSAARSLACIAGSVQRAEGLARARARDPRRLLFGEPWAVGAALARLSSADSPIADRSRLARELRVRCALKGPPYRAEASAEHQRLAVETIQQQTDARMTRYPAGTWLWAGHTTT